MRRLNHQPGPIFIDLTQKTPQMVNNNKITISSQNYEGKLIKTSTIFFTQFMKCLPPQIYQMR